MKAQAVTPTKETVEGDPQPTPNHNGQTGTYDQWQEVLQTENTTRNQTVEAKSRLQQVKPRKPKGRTKGHNTGLARVGDFTGKEI